MSIPEYVAFKSGTGMTLQEYIYKFQHKPKEDHLTKVDPIAWQKKNFYTKIDKISLSVRFSNITSEQQPNDLVHKNIQ